MTENEKPELTPEQKAAKELHEKKVRHLAELDQKVPHYEQSMHRNDCPHGKTRDGKTTHVRVRVDGGDSKTPWEDRKYWSVRAGHGEAQRVANVRAAVAAGKEACSSLSLSPSGTDREVKYINPKAAR